MVEKSTETKVQIPVERIVQRIFLIRGRKVMLDKDLAELYQVATKNLNRAVERNMTRFPSYFMFRLTKQELEDLRFQFGTSSWGRQTLSTLCLYRTRCRYAVISLEKQVRDRSEYFHYPRLHQDPRDACDEQRPCQENG